MFGRWSTRFTFVLALLSCSETAYAGRRVEIVVTGGDASGELASNITQLSDLVTNEYKEKKNGFEVIPVAAEKGMNAADFARIVSSLTNVDQLSIIFLSHGSIRNIDESFDKGTPFTSEQLKRFPANALASR